MGDLKLVTCVTDYCSTSISDAISQAMNLEFSDLTDAQQLFRMLSFKNYHTDAIIIDIEKLNNFPGVALLDIIMTLKTLVSCSCSSKKPHSVIPIGISVSVSTDIKLIKDVMSTGYVTGLYPSGDGFSLEEKMEALEKIINNKLHVPEKIHKLIHEKKKQTNQVKNNTGEIKLTARQQQILDLIVDRGASNKLIARILNISESTVKLHMTQILKKYGLTNRTQLALFTKSKNIDCSTN